MTPPAPPSPPREPPKTGKISLNLVRETIRKKRVYHKDPERPPEERTELELTIEVEGKEVSLTDSDEITPEQVKAALRRARRSAKSDLSAATKSAMWTKGGRTPSRAFKLPPKPKSGGASNGSG